MSQNVLLIDDSPALHRLVETRLEGEALALHVASDGLTGIEMARDLRPDLILLDIEMPTLSGEHVLDFTKLFDFLRATPIVLHSSKKEEDLQSLVARSHAIGYIKKTGNPMSLVAQVKSFLAPRNPDVAS